jgi:ABC-2 type transport system permease protein
MMNGERGMMNSRKQSALSSPLHPSDRRSPTPSPLRLLGAFLVRDFFTETSYRFAFLVGIGGVLFRTFIFYFLSQFIGENAAPLLSDYNGDYFSFVLIGLALGGYFGLGLSGFARALREAQTTGTLEALLMTPVPVSLIIVGSATWSYAYMTFRVLVYLLTGVLLLGVSFQGANVIAALLILLLGIIAFASIGIMAASVIMVIKRGDPVTAVLGNLANLVGGVYYPVEVMPGWLQGVAKLLPISYALHGMRLALLTGAGWRELLPDILTLGLFCIILFPLAILAFRYAVERARLEGSLAQY